MPATPSGRNSPIGNQMIVPFRQEWHQDYRDLVAEMLPAFPGGAAFHHIGSTAVPLMAAKDVIDIQATVASLESVDAARLERLGFAERVGLSDHPPEGGAVPPEELRKRFFKSTRRPANLHVRVLGRYNQRYPLLCRDFLRSHPVSAASYETIKQRLMRWFPGDDDRYYEIKDPLFDIILDGAEAWAERVGWTVPEPDV